MLPLRDELLLPLLLDEDLEELLELRTFDDDLDLLTELLFELRVLVVLVLGLVVLVLGLVVLVLGLVVVVLGLVLNVLVLGLIVVFRTVLLERELLRPFKSVRFLLDERVAVVLLGVTRLFATTLRLLIVLPVKFELL